MEACAASATGWDGELVNFVTCGEVTWLSALSCQLERRLFVGHVEEAEAREGVGFEQALLQELLLDLFDLNGLHLAAVWSEFAGGLFAERYQLGFRSSGQEGGEELFFEDGEGAVEFFEGLRSRLSSREQFSLVRRRRAAVSATAVAAGA